MRFTRERLDSKYQEALDNIDADKIRSIQSYLAEGIRFGGNKANGVKPWDLHKVAEESRKRILSALVREVAQPYNASCNVSPDNFIESEIRPYFDAFSLPNSCLGQAAPAVYGAKNRARQSTS
jgi:hypothetical protein